MPSSKSYLSLFIGLAGLALAGYLAFSLWHIRQETISTAIEQTTREAAEAAAQIDADLQRFMPLAKTLADELGSGRLTDQNLPRQLRALLDQNSDLVALGVAYAPFAFDAKRRLYAPYLMRDGNQVREMQIEDSYDYTDPTIKWYSDPAQRGAGWDEPTWGEASGALMSTYSVPFFRPDHEGRQVFAGVAFLSFPLEAIGQKLKEISAGQTGWSLLLSKAGYMIAHPNRREVSQRLNVFTYAEQRQDRVLLAAAKKMTSGEKGSFHFENPDTGQQLAIFYLPIPVTGWSLGVVRNKEEIPINTSLIRHQLIWLVLSLVVALACLTVVFSARQFQIRPIVTLWARVIILSLLLVCAAGTIEWLTYSHFGENGELATKIVDHNGMDSVLNSLRDARKSNQKKPPIFIPSGIYLQTVEFSAPHHLFVTGYFWQKFTTAQKHQNLVGFHLPTAISSNISEAYRLQEGAVETVGWYFEATLRQNMNFTKYPFAHETVGIHLWPKTVNAGIVLVPDLDSYNFLDPTSLPGLKKHLQLHGWTINRSFFSFKTNEYDTDFGISGFHDSETSPELRFNLEIRRNLLDSMISHIIPIILVATLLFVVLVTSTKDDVEAKRLGFNPSGVMRLSSGLLFVLLVSHIQLRTAIQVGEVIFLEYYYFIMYFMIIFTALHSLLFNLKTVSIRLVEHQQSLIFKLLYWPVLLGLQLLITVIIFY